MKRMDYKDQLVTYFKKNLVKGYDEDSLKFALFKQGYSRPIVEEALKDAHNQLAKEAKHSGEKPVIKYEVLGEENQVVHVQPLGFWDKIKYFFKGKK